MSQCSQFQQASWWGAVDAKKASHFHMLVIHPLFAILTLPTLTPLSIKYTVNA